MKLRNLFIAVSLTAISVMAQTNDNPITLRTMGSLLYGGTVTEMPDGATFHGDHGYAQYYIPAKSHTYPLIMCRTEDWYKKP